MNTTYLLNSTCIDSNLTRLIIDKKAEWVFIIPFRELVGNLIINSDTEAGNTENGTGSPDDSAADGQAVGQENADAQAAAAEADMAGTQAGTAEVTG